MNGLSRWQWSPILKTLMTIQAVYFISYSGYLFALPLSEVGSVKRAGMAFYNQYKMNFAITNLTLAAKAGDAEAQYFLAESIRNTNRAINEDVYKWYVLSASQDNVYAMIQLGRIGDDTCSAMGKCSGSLNTKNLWLQKALELTKPTAVRGDPEALCLMYEITLEKEWLERSASAGYALAQYWMAVGAKQGDGVYLPWRRHDAVINWLKQAAEGEYPPAMMDYAASIYEDKGDLSVARNWIIQTAENGYKSGVSSYGAYSAHVPSRYDFPLDLVKGYALTSLLVELDGGGDVQVYVNEVLPEIAQKMTPKQISAAEEFAKSWKATHPPLSFFPEKLSR